MIFKNYKNAYNFFYGYIEQMNEEAHKKNKKKEWFKWAIEQLYNDMSKSEIKEE